MIDQIIYNAICIFLILWRFCPLIIHLNLYSVGVLTARWNCDIINKIYSHIKTRATTTTWWKSITITLRYLEQTINHRWQVAATSDSASGNELRIHQRNARRRNKKPLLFQFWTALSEFLWELLPSRFRILQQLDAHETSFSVLHNASLWRMATHHGIRQL